MLFSKQRAIITVIILSVIGICSIALSCNNDKPAAVATSDGKALAEKYCKSCHEYPSPSMLNQETWLKHVLPAMAPRLGVKVYADDQYVNDPFSKSAIPYEDWLKIVNYYKASAPKALKPAHVPVAPVKDWGVFTLLKPIHDKVAEATTTMVAFDTIGHHIYTSDRLNSSVFKWSDGLKLQTTHKYSSPAVDVQFSKDAGEKEQGAFTFIGSMDAIDILNGYVMDIGLDESAKKQKKIIADKLPRPVQSLTIDVDKDGLADRIICGFGHNAGGLYWYKQLPDRKFEKHVICTIPGAEHAITGDFNHDGWPDVICLFAQADEGIWMFLNDHKGGFTATNLLRFPPVYGSSSFQLVDFNGDGKPDILYTCGDNSDYSKILKPYHGVYIYLNQGDFKYKQAYFYPVNGATKAIAADFNGDGQLDIALIAFFPDLKNNPAEGFTYFEQDKSMHFIPYNLPIEKAGRWICMDVADYNSDGKPDILLGNYAQGFMNEDDVKPDWNMDTPFILLKNAGGRHSSNKMK
ncbi:VCBS repeat-containing protein [Mucilaginibacter sabulilitoris]|uniref:VCBS repeat-containing protein n=1 Tax=Mucilaginibacter sabulilitoris TaxID=1173583 RepID=A0ABZ0TIN8_9SPHI|nr:VCBS repeat-containing protein [Mucilaginibacter sabulilitoris]WPU92073.1 VCBS repeat-containing protein [Mucilaginibacter sabulilitoris]